MYKTYGIPQSLAGILWLNWKEIPDFSPLAGRISQKNLLFLIQHSLPYLYCNAVSLTVMTQQSYHYQVEHQPLSPYINIASNRFTVTRWSLRAI